MKDYKCISIENDDDKNKQIFDSIQIGEKFYIITTNKSGMGLYKYLCVKTELDYSKKPFLHKNLLISCYRISCYICKQLKFLGGKPIKIKQNETMDKM